MTFRKSIVLFFACILAACANAAQHGLTFIHLNDTYRIGAVEDGTAGGFGRVVTLVRGLQAEGRDVHVLHGGDFLFPSLESQLWYGMQMVDAFNYIDAIAPMHAVAGNHEFDPHEPEYLVDAVRASNFDWLGDNYRFETGDDATDQRLRRTLLFESGGRRVGVFALTLHADDGGNDRDFAPIDRDYVGQAERAIGELEAAGAELIIGLTHLHLAIDLEIATLREAHPAFLFIAGGHEHEPEYAQLRAGRAAVMKGASNARQIWRIDVSFDDSGAPSLDARQIDVDESIRSDPGYDELEQRWRSQLLGRFPFLTARVGEAAVPLDGREVAIRNGESNWGNFVVDQMLTAFGQTPADLAFINSGTLRIDDYVAGDVTFEDIARTFGFSSYLVYLTMTGREFRDTLEAGFRGAGPSKGYFPQVAGFRVCADRSRADGDRIVSLQVPVGDGWQEIGSDREYRVVAPDFLLRGGDGYHFPEHRQASLRGSELRYLVLDAVLRAQAEDRKVGAPVDPDHPRIVILDGPGEYCWEKP